MLSTRTFLFRCSTISQRNCAIIQHTHTFSSLDAASSSKQPKKQKKKGKVKEGSGDKIYDTLVRCIDAPQRKAPRASEEEMARRFQIGKQYVIGKFKQHNELNHDLSCKIKMKRFAVKMLPRGTMLKEEALKITDDGPPIYRHIALDTPPIPGYQVSDWVRKEE